MSTNLYIYMAGDNNLDISARKDIEQELLTGNLSNKVNVFVQFDRRSPLPWEEEVGFASQRFKINACERQLIKDLGETNSGDATTLNNFLSECQVLEESNNHMAIIWGHGGGYKKNADFKNEGYRWVCIDDSSGDALDISEIEQSFEKLHSSMDVIAFDACLMGVLDVAYALKDKATYMVASQAIEPANGWPYHKLLERLEQNHGPIDDSLMERITYDYYETYGPTNKEVTLSCIQLERVEEVVQLIDELAVLFIDQVENYRSIYYNILHSVQRFKDLNYIDLLHFVLLCKQTLQNEEIRSVADTLILSFNKMLVSNSVKGAKYSNANGLSILFPINLTYQLPYELPMYKKYPNWLKFIELVLT